MCTSTNVLVQEANESMQEKSEIARLKAKIALEAEAGRRGMYGLASGTSRHDVISLRMERMGMLHGRLRDLIGDAEATHYLLDVMNQDYPPSASNVP